LPKRSRWIPAFQKSAVQDPHACLEIAAARAAISEHERRFPGVLYAKQQEALRAQISAYQAAYQAQNVGHP
jgi:hypothetical protein